MTWIENIKMCVPYRIGYKSQHGILVDLNNCTLEGMINSVPIGAEPTR